MSTTLIITGAGMSKNLGLPTSKEIDDVIKILLDFEYPEAPLPIHERIKAASEIISFDEIAESDFIFTLSMLFDGDGAKNNQGADDKREKALADYIEMYKSMVPNTNQSALKHHLIYLTQTYDLLSLKSIIYSLKHSSVNIDIVDILTAIQKSISDGISIPTREIFPEEKTETRSIYYCDRKRLVGALNAYKLLFYKLFKHILRNVDSQSMEIYENFFYEIAKDYSGLNKLNNVKESWKKENYLSDVGYLTYNWDPILPFLSMKCNQKLNQDLLQESGNGICKKLYIDFGVPFAGTKLSGEHSDSSVYSFGEDAAFLINAFTKDSYTKYSDIKSKLLIKIMKLFVPHGLVNIRICPRCQNGLFIFPENIGDLKLDDIANLFTSDPIPSKFDLDFISKGKYERILPNYEKGMPDEIDCPSCDHPVYFEHTFMEIQSIIKDDKPSAVNKIHFDYADFFSRADHIVAIGYSFPKDDIMNSVFLKNMKIRKDELGKDCKLTYIGYSAYCASDDWTKFNDLDFSMIPDLEPTINNLTGIFKKDHMRFNFTGFPSILNTLNTHEVLNWK